MAGRRVAAAYHDRSALRRKPGGYAVARLVRCVSAVRSSQGARRSPDPDEKRIPKPPESPEWVEIRDKASEALGKSKDLRLLAHLGTALLRTDGVPAFSETLKIASHWLDTYWTQTYPLVDEDAVPRQSALNCFADHMAVVDALRRLPLVSSREHGRFGLREIEIATGQLLPGAGDPRHDFEQIKAAFAVMPLEELAGLHESVVGAVAALRRIDAKISRFCWIDAAPQLQAAISAARKDGPRGGCPARIASRQ